MTAQDAFQYWLFYSAMALGGLLVLALLIAVIVAAFSASRRRDE